MSDYQETASGILMPAGTVDGLTNVATGLGTSLSKRSFNRFQPDLLNDFSQYEAAYQSNWIARKIVDIPAEDMTREWRTIKSKDAEAISACEQELDLQNSVSDALSWAGAFGGAAILMMTGQDLTKPLDINKIKKGDLERLMVFDRWEVHAQSLNTWNVLAPNYLQAEYYTVQGGQTSIHWSHFIKFMGAKLPRRMLAQTQGWGDSELRKCLEDLQDISASKGGIAELMQEANVDVIKRTDLINDLASDQDQNIEEYYTLQRQMKGNIKMLLMDKEEEDYTRNTLNLSGVSNVLEILGTWVSGAADIPYTRFFGVSAGGLNATGEGDMLNYYAGIGSKQVQKINPGLRYLDQVLVRSAVGSYPEDYDWVWNPLQQQNTLETAQADDLTANKHQKYLDMNVVTVSQIQRELQANEDYQFADGQIEDLEKAENEFDFNVESDNDSDDQPTAE